MNIMRKSGQVIVGLVENKTTEKRRKWHVYKKGKEELEGHMSYEPIGPTRKDKERKTENQVERLV